MAFKLDGSPLAVDVAFTTSDGTQYPANWLRLSTADEKTALGITEVADDPVYDGRFYNGDGSGKELNDVNAKDAEGNLLKNPDGTQMVILGVKSVLKAQEKEDATMDDEGLADFPGIPPTNSGSRSSLFTEESLMSNFARMLNEQLQPMKVSIETLNSNICNE